MEHEGYTDTNCYWCIQYSKKRSIKGNGGLRGWRTGRSHLNYNIVENGQNTEKSPGDLRILADTIKQVEMKHKIWKEYIRRTKTRDKTLPQKPHQRNKYLGCAPH